MIKITQNEIDIQTWTKLRAKKRLETKRALSKSK